MGPANGANKTSLPGSSATITIPKLDDNGSNWVDYKTKVMIAMGSRGLMGIVEGRALKQKPYNIVGGVVPVLPDGKTAASDEQIEAHKKRMEDYETKMYLARHIMINSRRMMVNSPMRRTCGRPSNRTWKARPSSTKWMLADDCRI